MDKRIEGLSFETGDHEESTVYWVETAEADRIVSPKIAFLTIYSSDSAQNPLEASDGMGSISSFNPRHTSYESPCVAKRADEVLLSYFEHGLCRWGVQGTMNNMPDFRWDGTFNAGIWRPDAALLQEAKGLKGKERRDKMEQWAEEACEYYTQWCNGSVWDWRFVVYQARFVRNGSLYDKRTDYRFDDPVLEESGFEYYDVKDIKMAVNDAMLRLGGAKFD